MTRVSPELQTPPDALTRAKPGFQTLWEHVALAGGLLPLAWVNTACRFGL
jgi:hypothetical protein